MPLDDETKRELDAIREELRGDLDELRRARTPVERRSARDAIADTREDLEDVLRREGYRLSRRELDEIMRTRDDERISAAVDRRLAELKAAEEDDDDDGGGDGDDQKKKPPAGRRKKAPATGGDGETEEEWT